MYVYVINRVSFHVIQPVIHILSRRKKQCERHVYVLIWFAFCRSHVSHLSRFLSLSLSLSRASESLFASVKPKGIYYIHICIIYIMIANKYNHYIQQSYANSSGQMKWTKHSQAQIISYTIQHTGKIEKKEEEATAKIFLFQIWNKNCQRVAVAWYISNSRFSKPSSRHFCQPFGRWQMETLRFSPSHIIACEWDAIYHTATHTLHQFSSFTNVCRERWISVWECNLLCSILFDSFMFAI